MKEPKKGTGKLTKIRKKKGESNAYKYEGTPEGKAYAGPDKTFPIGNKAHARSALKLAHNAKNPAAIKAKVHARYPDLGKKKGAK